MEKINFEGTKEKQILPDWVKKIRNYSLASTVALTSFLASCDNGPKEKASLEDVQTHIENADFEKVSPETVKAFELKFEANDKFSSEHPELKKFDTHRYFDTRVQEPHSQIDSKTTKTYSITETDSLLEINFSNELSYKDGFDDKNWHAEVDRKTGIITYFNYANQSAFAIYEGNGLEGKGLLSLYVIEKGGEVDTKGDYQAGQGKAFVEQVAQEIKDMKDGDGLTK